MDTTSSNPSQSAKVIHRISYYLLIGIIFGAGIHFLLQGIAQILME